MYVLRCNVGLLDLIKSLRLLAFNYDYNFITFDRFYARSSGSPMKETNACTVMEISETSFSSFSTILNAPRHRKVLTA